MLKRCPEKIEIDGKLVQCARITHIPYGNCSWIHKGKRYDPVKNNNVSCGHSGLYN